MLVLLLSCLNILLPDPAAVTLLLPRPCCCRCTLMVVSVLQMVLSVLGIAGGTALAAYGEVHNSLLGLLIMFASEALEAIRLVMTQLLLTGHKMGPFEGLMWMVSE